MRTPDIVATLGGCDFGERLTRLRLARGLTQQDLSEQSGVASAHIARLEADRHLPQPLTVRKLAFALGLTTEEFLTGEMPSRSSQLKVPAA